MKKVAVLCGLLIAGMVGAQLMSGLPGAARWFVGGAGGFLCMVGLAFIMIQVGYEFDLQKENVRVYGWDYLVATATAGGPWLLVSVYFLLALLPSEFRLSSQAWKEVLLAGRFAAPTAAGVLFALLIAAGLRATWMYRKTQILVIFNDLNTVLLMIPLKILMVGLAWQLGVIVAIMLLLLGAAWRWLHRIPMPMSWFWVLTYSAVIASISEAVYWGAMALDYRVAIHLEVLLPAFVLGCIMERPKTAVPHPGGGCESHEKAPETTMEGKGGTVVSAVFMVLVGLTLPTLSSAYAPGNGAPWSLNTSSITASQAPLTPTVLVWHVFVLTILMNIGKALPAFLYRREAHWEERLAVALALCPRGAVGAGVLLLSLDYGIGGPVVSIIVLTLALNLLLTPAFVYALTCLLRSARSAV